MYRSCFGMCISKNAQKSPQEGTNMETKEKQKNKVKFGIKPKLLLMGMLPALAILIVLVIASMESMTDGMYKEMKTGLNLLAKSAEVAIDEKYPGDYTVQDGMLYKGDVNLSEDQTLLDAYVADEDAQLTITFGKERMLTTLTDVSTGERMVNTEISDEAWNTVQAGEIYTANRTSINDISYASCYIPITNSDGTVVGAFFAGIPSAEVVDFINQQMNIILLAAIVIMLISVVLTIRNAGKLAGAVKKAEESVVLLANGDLTAEVSPKILNRSDEIGQMGRAVENLITKLRATVEVLKQSADKLMNSGNSLNEMADQSAAAADEISRAVEDISKGAVNQAEEIEHASKQIGDMGEEIEQIVGNVGNLVETSDAMSSAGSQSTKTMGELSEANDRTTSAIKNIADQITLTNESIQKISASAALITAIADETSLLSLNASIESARAGEAGRGFAVVAGEIQKLSVQSDDAAKEIQNIISILQKESEKMVVVMKEAESLIEEQQAKLMATKTSFDEVSEGISVSRQGTDAINTKADACDRARAQVVDVITNLSAISQQNAASAEETTASMQELNATIDVLAEAAGSLQELSQSLNKEMEFFRI